MPAAKTAEKTVDPLLDMDDVLESELESWLEYRPTRTTPGNEADVMSLLHRAKPAALCLSGGGIRSATFGLGILQGLARKGLLQEFDYLSTVSDGGYIGSWLTSWFARRASGSLAEEERKAALGR